MEVLSQEELLELFASADSYAETEEKPDSAAYKKSKEKARSNLSGGYHFSLPVWDVIELMDAPTVKQFSGQNLNMTALGLDILEVKRKGDYDSSIRPDPPVLRYFLLVPGSPEAEEARNVLRMYDLPVIDRSIVVALLLVDEDIYVPVGAFYRGTVPSQREKKGTTEAIDMVARAMTSELHKENIVRPAPRLLETLKALIEDFKDHAFDEFEKMELIQQMMRLPDDAFIDAVGRILPLAWSNNEWFSASLQLRTRVSDYKIKNPKLKNDMAKAPHKTAVMRPTPFDPIIQFETPGKYGRRNVEKEKLELTR